MNPRVVVTSRAPPRAGWADAARLLRERGDDRLLDAPTRTRSTTRNGEGGAFFVLARPVDAPQGASEELLSHLHREPMARSRVRMAPLSEERDRLRDHVVRGEYDVLQEPPPIALEDLPHAGVVLVSLDE